MQIDGGKNDMFAAWADSGGLVMGHFDGSGMAMWKLAQAVRAGRQLLHGRLRRLVPQPPVPDLRLRAGVPERRHRAGAAADHRCSIPTHRASSCRASRRPRLAGVGARRPADVRARAATSRRRTTSATARSARSTRCSRRTSRAATRPRRATPRRLRRTPPRPTTLPPQTQATIGDLPRREGRRAGRGIPARGTQRARPTARCVYHTPRCRNFQAHHQPFNYYAAFDPVTHAADRARAPEGLQRPAGRRRGRHAAAGGLLQAGGQPQPAPRLCQRRRRRRAHRRPRRQAAGEPAVAAHGDRHHLRRERRHLGPRRAAQGRPARARARASRRSSSRRSRRRATVDHTQYDTASILRLITRRWSASSRCPA